MEVQTGAQERFAQVRDEPLTLLHWIHTDPEIRFEEETAARWLVEMLDEVGLSAKTGEVLFRARSWLRPGASHGISASGPSMTAGQGSAMPVGIPY